MSSRRRKGSWSGAAVAAVMAVTTAAGALLPPGPPVAAAADTARPASPAYLSPNPVLQWDRLVLDAIRERRTAPTVAARALAVLHTCMYDAWAAYDPVAVGTRLGGALRRPAAERTPEARHEAVSRAAHRAAIDLYAELTPRFDRTLRSGGYQPAGSPPPGSPGGVARAACEAVLDLRHGDGANQLGNEPGSDGTPYSDWTGYEPVNDPDRVRDPDRWQPLRVPDGAGGTAVQQFLTPQWGRVTSFAAGGFAPPDPGPPRSGTAARAAEMDELLQLSARLTDEQKVIAEYWADGPGTVVPAGHWMLFGHFCSRRDAHGLDMDVKLFFVLANAMFDAGIATWAGKREFDSIRPVSLVRLSYAGRRVEAWGGPYRGRQEIDGSQWRPYLPTPPFAEYPSGHSTFSAAGAEALRLFTGRDDFGATVVIPAGSSAVEPGAVPAHDVTLRWATFDEAADQAGLSRRLGGIHFASGDLAGRLVGRRVAARVVARAQEYFNGVGRQGVEP